MQLYALARRSGEPFSTMAIRSDSRIVRVSTPETPRAVVRAGAPIGRAVFYYSDSFWFPNCARQRARDS